MDFANRGNRPGQQIGPDINQPSQPMGDRGHNSSNKPKLKMKFDLGKVGTLALLLTTTLLIVAVILAIVSSRGDSKPETDLIDTSRYQAVFLNSQDGQVYFGKLDIYNKDLYSLTDIYYVRVNQQVQPGSETPTQNISLAKLGGELHCPVDQMFIARDQVLYWENIRDEGQVVTAIKEYQQSGENVQCGAQATANQQQNQGSNNGTAPSGTEASNDTTTGTPGNTPEQ